MNEIPYQYMNSLKITWLSFFTKRVLDGEYSTLDCLK